MQWSWRGYMLLAGPAMAVFSATRVVCVAVSHRDRLPAASPSSCWSASCCVQVLRGKGEIVVGVEVDDDISDADEPSTAADRRPRGRDSDSSSDGDSDSGGDDDAFEDATSVVRVSALEQVAIEAQKSTIALVGGWLCRRPG